MDLPRRISKYELVEFLGGGMSHVFRATDTVLGRTVAIKILTPAGVADPDVRARFLQEARTASSITHENIISVYDFGDADGYPYMVMEFLGGHDLRHAIKNHIFQTLSEKLHVAQQIARALAYVHERKIVHRDIKPENVHVDAEGHAKLMDFGIAKAADLSLTQPGYVLGTPYYMAPEQVLGKPVTELVDVYAFGILLYELLVGEKPFSGATIEQIFYKVMHEPVALKPLTDAHMPPAVIDLVRCCTEKDPAKRPPSCAAVANDIGKVMAQLDRAAAALEAAKPRKLRKPIKPPMGVIAGASVALLLVMVAVAFYATRHSRQSGEGAAKAVPTALPVRIDDPGGPLLLVAAGPYLSGKDKRTASLPAFYIDETEVSNRQYAAFCSATHRSGCPKPNDLPVVNVSIADARQYAGWAGKRLPTGAEWEKAARGVSGFTFPWGDNPDASRANVSDNLKMTHHGLTPVNQIFQNSLSPYRAIDMAGNVWELVEERRTPDAQSIKLFTDRTGTTVTGKEPWCAIRGGSYARPLQAAVSYEFAAIPERYRSVDIGFRCARSAPR